MYCREKKHAPLPPSASQQINVGFMLQLFQYTVEYVTVIMPYVIVAERYFKGLLCLLLPALLPLPINNP